MKDFLIIFTLLFLVSCSSVHKPCTDPGIECESQHVLNNNHPPEMPGTFR